MVPLLHPPFSFIIGFIVFAYALGGVAAAIKLQPWGLQRFLPLLSVIIPAIAISGVLRHSTSGWASAFMIGCLLSPVLVLFSLLRAWDGDGFIVRLLRVSGTIVLGYGIYSILALGVP